MDANNDNDKITFFSGVPKRTYINNGFCADKKCNESWSYDSESLDGYDKIYCVKHWRRNIEQKQN